jgi:hypothetical protein
VGLLNYSNIRHKVVMRNSRASRTTMKWQTLARLFKGEGGGSRRLAKKPPTCNHIHVSQALNNMDQIATSSWETTHWSTIRTSSPAGPSHLLHVICARSKQHLYSPLSFQNLYRIKIVPHQHYMCLPLRIITLSRQELDVGFFCFYFFIFLPFVIDHVIS